jgi:hypothetical protein
LREAQTKRFDLIGDEGRCALRVGQHETVGAIATGSFIGIAHDPESRDSGCDYSVITSRRAAE